MKTLIKIFGSNEPYVSPTELAKLFNIRSETVSDWLSRYSDFPAVRLPGHPNESFRDRAVARSIQGRAKTK
jgi:hypothetical protein